VSGVLSPLALLLKAKRAAMKAENYVPKPWFHGTNTELKLAPKAMWLGDPTLANMFTSGDRGNNLLAAINGGRLFPFVLKDNEQVAGKKVNVDFTTGRARIAQYLEQMGLQLDDLDLDALHKAAATKENRGVPYLYDILEQPAVARTATEQFGLDSSFLLSHPRYDYTITPEGEPWVSGSRANANKSVPVKWVPNAQGALKSIFEFRKGGGVWA